MKLKLLIVLLSCSIISLSAKCKTSNKEVTFNQQDPHWFMQLGIQKGGDSTEPLPIYNRADGQLYIYSDSLTVVGPWSGISYDVSWEDEAKAGGFWKFEFGRETPISKQVTISTSFGYQTDYIEGDLTDGSGGRGSFEMSRFTFDTIAFYNIGQHRFGLGAAYHFSPNFIHKEHASSFKLKSTYEFDDALGAIFQYDYLVNEDVSVGFRLTKISYDLTDLSVRYNAGSFEDDFDLRCGNECKELINADSLGIHITMRF